jgi:uncharacterized protein (TIGR00288 family)
MSEKIALFIDGDNISHKDASLIINEVKSYGKIILSMVYADWSTPERQGWLVSARKNGITPIQCDIIHGKNSSDIKLAIDVMSELHRTPHITTYFIVTSDSDYRHLISEIKKADKLIYCIGSKIANEALQNICDIYTKIEVLRDQDKMDETDDKDDIDDIVVKNTVPLKNERKKSRKTMLKRYLKDIEQLFDEMERVSITDIKTLLQRKYQFDSREYKCRNIKYFLKRYFNKNIEICSDHKGVYIKLREI